MLKKVSVVVFLITFAFASFVFAGEGSDTIGAGNLKPQLRYSYERVDYDMEILIASLDLKNDENTAYLELDWGVHDNVDLYAIIGSKWISSSVADGDFDLSLLGGPTIGITLDNKIDPSLLLGAGVRATFFRSESGFYCGGGMLFTYAISGDDGYTDIDVEIGGTTLSIDTEDFLSIQWEEMDFVADLHAGYNIEKIGLTPYVGVEYRWVNAEADVEILNISGLSFSVDCEPEYPVGVYAGFDYMPIENLYINVEGHLINRWGVNVGIGYLFDL